MIVDAPPRSADEVARLGADLVRRVIGPALLAGDAGRFVCVDVDTGAYEVDDDDLSAVDRLRARRPGADTYLGRVGEAATFRMGPR